MIMKKHGELFCDAWYYHVCKDTGDANDERILFDDLKKKWQFIDRGFEVDIEFCPFCGKALRDLRPGAAGEGNERDHAVHCKEEQGEDRMEAAECSIRCMFCSREVKVQVGPKLEECTSGECNHCRAKVEFDIFR